MAGKPCTITPWLKTWYEEAGFVDVREEIFRLPTCGWPEDPEEKIIGTWMEEMLNSGIDGILRAYQLRVAGLTMEQHQVCSTMPWSFLPIINKGIGACPAWLHTDASVPLRYQLGPFLTMNHTTGGSYTGSERSKKSGLPYVYEFSRCIRPEARDRHKPRIREDTRIYRAGRRTNIVIRRQLRLAWTTVVVYY